MINPSATAHALYKYGHSFLTAEEIEDRFPELTQQVYQWSLKNRQHVQVSSRTGSPAQPEAQSIQDWRPSPSELMQTWVSQRRDLDHFYAQRAASHGQVQGPTSAWEIDPYPGAVRKGHGRSAPWQPKGFPTAHSLGDNLEEHLSTGKSTSCDGHCPEHSQEKRLEHQGSASVSHDLTVQSQQSPIPQADLKDAGVNTSIMTTSKSIDVVTKSMMRLEALVSLAGNQDNIQQTVTATQTSTAHSEQPIHHLDESAVSQSKEVLKAFTSDLSLAPGIQHLGQTAVDKRSDGDISLSKSQNDCPFEVPLLYLLEQQEEHKECQFLHVTDYDVATEHCHFLHVAELNSTTEDITLHDGMDDYEKGPFVNQSAISEVVHLQIPPLEEEESMAERLFVAPSMPNFPGVKSPKQECKQITPPCTTIEHSQAESGDAMEDGPHPIMIGGISRSVPPLLPEDVTDPILSTSDKPLEHIPLEAREVPCTHMGEHGLMSAEAIALAGDRVIADVVRVVSHEILRQFLQGLVSQDEDESGRKGEEKQDSTSDRIAPAPISISSDATEHDIWIQLVQNGIPPIRDIDPESVASLVRTVVQDMIQDSKKSDDAPGVSLSKIPRQEPVSGPRILDTTQDGRQQHSINMQDSAIEELVMTMLLDDLGRHDRHQRQMQRHRRIRNHRKEAVEAHMSADDEGDATDVTTSIDEPIPYPQDLPHEVNSLWMGSAEPSTDPLLMKPSKSNTAEEFNSLAKKFRGKRLRHRTRLEPSQVGANDDGFLPSQPQVHSERMQPTSNDDGLVHEAKPSGHKSGEQDASPLGHDVRPPGHDDLGCDDKVSTEVRSTTNEHMGPDESPSSKSILENAKEPAPGNIRMTKVSLDALKDSQQVVIQDPHAEVKLVPPTRSPIKTISMPTQTDSIQEPPLEAHPSPPTVNPIETMTTFTKTHDGESNAAQTQTVMPTTAIHTQATLQMKPADVQATIKGVERTVQVIPDAHTLYTQTVPTLRHGMHTQTMPTSIKNANIQTSLSMQRTLASESEAEVESQSGSKTDLKIEKQLVKSFTQTMAETNTIPTQVTPRDSIPTQVTPRGAEIIPTQVTPRNVNTVPTQVSPTDVSGSSAQATAASQPAVNLEPASSSELPPLIPTQVQGITLGLVNHQLVLIPSSLPVELQDSERNRAKRRQRQQKNELKAAKEKMRVMEELESAKERIRTMELEIRQQEYEGEKERSKKDEEKESRIKTGVQHLEGDNGENVDDGSQQKEKEKAMHQQSLYLKENECKAQEEKRQMEDQKWKDALDVQIAATQHQQASLQHTVNALYLDYHVKQMSAGIAYEEMNIRETLIAMEDKHWTYIISLSMKEHKERCLANVGDPGVLEWRDAVQRHHAQSLSRASLASMIWPASSVNTSEDLLVYDSLSISSTHVSSLSSQGHVLFATTKASSTLSSGEISFSYQSEGEIDEVDAIISSNLPMKFPSAVDGLSRIQKRGGSIQEEKEIHSQLEDRSVRASTSSYMSEGEVPNSMIINACCQDWDVDENRFRNWESSTLSGVSIDGHAELEEGETR